MLCSMSFSPTSSDSAGAHWCVCVWRPSPVETWDFCWAEVWRVRRSRLPLICSSTLWGSGARRTESSSPSAFHVRNWKRSENAPPVPPATAAAAAATVAGSDRKLALELRKVAAACWGSEQEKVTLPWRPERDRVQCHLAIPGVEINSICNTV